MKRVKREPVYLCSLPPDDKEDAKISFNLYKERFLTLIDCDFEVDYDLMNRYKIKLSIDAGYLTEEEKNELAGLDKQYISNYKKGAYKTHNYMSEEELAVFFEWLETQI